jgi:periplasmic protein TonB
MSSWGRNRSLEEREVAMSNPPDSERRFEALQLGVMDAPPPPRVWTRFVSIALHAALLLTVLVVPLLRDDSLPEKADRVQAFFAAPPEFAPPPPPPPPPTAPARAVPQAHVQQATPGFVAPVEVPTEIVPEEGLDLGTEGGMPGGVEGGVPGGVVGGVVGGLPDAPPPVPAVRPVRAGVDVREPRKVKSVAPVYPALAVKAGVGGRVVLECRIDARGRVADVKVVTGNPVLIDAAVEAVRQWIYTPTLLNGVPVPVLMDVTVTFSLTDR